MEAYAVNVNDVMKCLSTIHIDGMEFDIDPDIQNASYIRPNTAIYFNNVHGKSVCTQFRNAVQNKDVDGSELSQDEVVLICILLETLGITSQLEKVKKLIK